MTPYPRPHFSHAARAIRARIWQRIRLQFAAMSAVLLWAATLLLGVMTASEGRWVTVEATAYCPCSLCCDERTERTANGTNTNREPYGVAASRNLPFGTTLFIPVGAGYLDETYPRDSQRLFTVDDRGSALDSERRRYGHTRIDLRYRSHDFAVRFGRRLISVFITN
jgi:3D (Asp-Asp-Asp) domain-containing protein